VDENQVLVGGMVGGAVVLISLVAIVGGFLQCRRERLLTHAERMKALELGQSMPDDAATARIKAVYRAASRTDDEEGGTLARKCFTTGFWVAFWGFLAAAGHGSAGASPGVAYVIAASTGAIGVTAVICGTILAARVPAEGTSRFAPTKPVTESDAFDVVSRRG
jgi:hypothetical protein